ncbi:MAG: phenylalanyl-tRNA synthetase, alpha subunit [Acidobacteriaceae bacterium]|jgi:phenylalanyl-tRNA synthetase alpha chain|nr:phenylalanyl-tRNA synthetase, alpha subunit [Acidobacteriaceae bacterium]
MAYTVPKLKDFSAKALDKAAAKLLSALEDETKAVASEGDWKEFRDRWMGRKNGVLTQINVLWLKAAPKDEKKQVGQRVNELNKQVEAKVDTALQRAQGGASEAKLAAERVDITLPGNVRPLGAEHPIIKTMNEIVSVFRNLGYSVEEGPEIETDYYNFEALNFPPNHPARDTQDTIFIANQESKATRDRLLLRTHTSPVQIRAMERTKPPIRIVVPGKVHRNDAADATHSPVFHQVEGLAVDTNITFSDLKGTLDHAMKALFGSSVKTRFYPSFFPFTEPSADVQISCLFCGGKGYRDGGRCPNCKASGWIELLGCGMVDPNVYGFADYDAKKVSGFAFGMGVERIAILKYGVDDIQMFYHGDVRFLEQFR